MIYGGNITVDTEDYLSECNPVNVIPAYASINEMVYHVIESSEEDFNSIMMECGVIELNHLEETGMEMVYEEGKIGSLVEKVKGAFEEMWKKVQGMFQRAIEFFETQSKKFRDSVMKKINKAMVDSRINNIKKDKDYGSTYDYQNIKDYSSKLIDKIGTAQTAIYSQYTSLSAKIKANEGDNVSVEKLDKDISEAIKNCVNSIAGGASNGNTSGMVKTMKTDIRGKRINVSGQWVIDHMKGENGILKEVETYPDTKKTLKENYNKLKKDFNETIKLCNKEKKENRSNAAAFTKVANGWKKLKQISVYCQQAVISCLNERYNFFRGIVIRVLAVRKGDDSKKTTATGESTTFDTIGSLFDNWD